jgi:hypothetical protein
MGLFSKMFGREQGGELPPEVLQAHLQELQERREVLNRALGNRDMRTQQDATDLEMVEAEIAEIEAKLGIESNPESDKAA